MADQFDDEPDDMPDEANEHHSCGDPNCGECNLITIKRRLEMSNFARKVALEVSGNLQRKEHTLFMSMLVDLIGR